MGASSQTGSHSPASQLTVLTGRSGAEGGRSEMPPPLVDHPAQLQQAGWDSGGGAPGKGSGSEKATSQKDRGRFRRKEGGVTPPPALTAETATENVAEKPRLRGNGACSPSPRLPSLGARFLCRRLWRRFLRRVFSKPLPPPPRLPLTRQLASSLQRATARGQPSTTRLDRGSSSQHGEQHGPLPPKSPAPAFLESRGFL